MALIKQHGTKDVLKKLQSAFQEKAPSTRAALDPVKRTLTGLFSPSSTSKHGNPSNISQEIPIMSTQDFHRSGNKWFASELDLKRALQKKTFKNTSKIYPEWARVLIIRDIYIYSGNKAISDKTDVRAQ